MTMVKSILGFMAGGFLFSVFFLIGVGLKILSLVVLGFIIYAFFAMGGIVPPVDYIPFVPYV